MKKQSIRVDYDKDENLTDQQKDATQIAPKLKKYNTVKGDKVDEHVKEILEDSEVLIPIIRISQGFYLIGAEKKQVSIKGGSVLVRVGGGYEKIDDFIARRELDELMKMKKMVDDKGVSFKEVVK